MSLGQDDSDVDPPQSHIDKLLRKCAVQGAVRVLQDEWQAEAVVQRCQERWDAI